MISDSETLNMPAIIEQTKQGDYGFISGAIPRELKGIRYKTLSDAFYALAHSEAVKAGEIVHFQIQENNQMSKPYRKVNDRWVKDGGEGVYLATVPH